jgi:hypothetical protein
VISNGFRSTLSRAVLPRQSVTATVISFALNGLASSQVVAHGGSETVASERASTQNCTERSGAPGSA